MSAAIVTGASGGIGRAVAVALAKMKYHLVLTYNTHKEECESLAQVIWENYGVQVLAMKCDVKSPQEVKEVVKTAVNSFEKIQVLVNNAGIAQQKLFTDITDEDWFTMINTNLSGAFYMCREVLPYMIYEKSGRIINIASMWGEIGGSCEVHYSAAKAGLIGLTRALAKEVAPSGITVNCVSPGVIMTDMMSGFDEETIKSLTEETPVGRLGTPRDVAKAVEFLAHESSSFITGEILRVNGGFF